MITTVKKRKGSYRQQFSKAYSYGASHIDNSIPQKEKDPGSFTLPCYINNVCFNNALADLGASEGEVVEEFRARNDARMVSKIFGYPSDYNQGERIRIDYALNLKFSCMIGFEFIHSNFLLNLPINVMSKKFYNLIMKDKIEFKGRNELGNWANVPIFIRNFCVLNSFAVVENMDPYIGEGMGEVVVGKPFCEVSCMETKRFDGVITIHGEDESVTYQMVRSHPRFKCHTNKQCNKILPLLKVNEEDKMNRISHSYQKLKRFYKGVLNLGPDFIRDPSMDEWLTCENVSVHEMEW
ncbi:hypothetical protein Tco_0215980 [Tanacetum coccineum]